MGNEGKHERDQMRNREDKSIIPITETLEYEIILGWPMIEKYTGLKKSVIRMLAKNVKKGQVTPFRLSASGRPMVVKKELDKWFSEQKYFFKKRNNLKGTGRGNRFKQRFEILKRDNFTCQYCGRSPRKDDGVVLQVDHIIPRSKSGNDSKENLITSCIECNLGKLDVLL